LNFTAIGTFGTNVSDYYKSTACGASLAPGASCAVTVSFQPTGTGPRYAAVFFADNAPASPQIVGLTGNGVGPSPAVSLPSGVAFGSVPVTPGSAQKTVTLTNTGAASLTFTSDPSLTGANERDFAVAASTCSPTEPVAVGTSCTVTLTFTPAALGEAESATLNFADNATPSTQAVPITGTGLHWISLEGTASTTPGVTAYNIYRGTVSGAYGSTPVKTCSSLATATSCMDFDLALVAGQLYYYVVKAVHAGVESAASNQTSVVFP
jgi:hypothetical protein